MGLGSFVSKASGGLLGGAAAAPVLGTIGGSLLGGGLGYMGVKDTNDANAAIASARNVFEREEAVKARDFSAEQSLLKRGFDKNQAALNRQFQERMSSSAVQRRMEDMKAAGINPILAGKYDASSPAGAMASAGIGATAKANAHGYTAGNKIGGALDRLGTALSLVRQMEEIKNIRAQTASKTQNVNIAKFLENVSLDTTDIYKTYKHWLANDARDMFNLGEQSISRAVDNAVDKYLPGWMKKSNKTYKTNYPDPLKRPLPGVPKHKRKQFQFQ